MPGSVTLATASGTFPFSKFSAYQASWDYSHAYRENTYANGESQRDVMGVASPLRLIRLSLRLRHADAATLRTFYEARGEHTPFSFTPVGETSAITMKFASDWAQEHQFGRTEVSLTLIQVA